MVWYKGMDKKKLFGRAPGMEKALAGLLLIMMWASCATSSGGNAGAAAEAAPLWVTDRNAAFPDSRWLCVVESDRDKNTAQAAALNALARVFRTDILAVTNAYQEFAQVAAGSGNKKIAAFTESKDFAQEVTTTSNITGLIGVQSDVWTAKDGMSHANARMNRAECAARYSAMIRENEKVIGLLKEEAARSPGTFDAFESLNFALTVAVVTDSFQSLLEVLDSGATSRRPNYGNADAVKLLVQEAARSVIITVQVQDDVSDRIAKAFAAFLEKKGFRTNSSGANSYLLAAKLELEDVALGNNQPNKFVRYLLTAGLKDGDGKEVFSYSGNGREGHVSESEARQRALRAAEASIASGVFAKDFDAYLVSLLK
ncbi:hypothetical protein AGMMS50268_11880 [Spirochaetia bacterium]|nr:hypothetical protein AGMMS50268_11880 [Spirochaetia bacterium]